MTWAPRALLLVALAILGVVAGVVVGHAVDGSPSERIRPVELPSPTTVTTAPVDPGAPLDTTTTVTTAPPVLDQPAVTVLPPPTVPLDDDDDGPGDDDDDGDDDGSGDDDD